MQQRITVINILNKTFFFIHTHIPGNYSCLQVELIFSRDRTFYFATIFIPGLILVTSSFITFFLEWDAVPARTIIGHYYFFLFIIFHDFILNYNTKSNVNLRIFRRYDNVELLYDLQQFPPDIARRS